MLISLAAGGAAIDAAAEARIAMMNMKDLSLTLK